MYVEFHEKREITMIKWDYNLVYMYIFSENYTEYVFL